MINDSNMTLGGKGRGEYILQTKTSGADSYDEYIYVRMEYPKVPTVIGQKWTLDGLEPVIEDVYRSTPVGHCYKLRSISGVAVGAETYFGSIDQPCSDGSLVVALDPDDLPEVASDSSEDVSYDLDWDSDDLTWDGGSSDAIAENTLIHLTGVDGDSGSIYVAQLASTICLDSENDSVSLNVYVAS